MKVRAIHSATASGGEGGDIAACVTIPCECVRERECVYHGWFYNTLLRTSEGTAEWACLQPKNRNHTVMRAPTSIVCRIQYA